ncbi:MAG: hypothetical protein WA184_25325, partial [Stellaceae bacterium]
MTKPEAVVAVDEHTFLVTATGHLGELVLTGSSTIARRAEWRNDLFMKRMETRETAAGDGVAAAWPPSPGAVAAQGRTAPAAALPEGNGSLAARPAGIADPPDRLHGIPLASCRRNTALDFLKFSSRRRRCWISIRPVDILAIGGSGSTPFGPVRRGAARFVRFGVASRVNYEEVVEQSAPPRQSIGSLGDATRRPL